MSIKKKILVTGATGFTGSFVVSELTKAGYDVYCFVRESSNTSVLSRFDINYIMGNLNKPETLNQALMGMDALVNVASIGFGHAPLIVRTCEEVGVNRAIFFSSTAIFTTLEAQSKKIRMEAEKAIAESKLDYTIFRPTMIYGTPHDRNMIRLIKFVDRFSFVPVFGPGTSVQQPVFVCDLARAVANVIEVPKTYRKEYNLSGKEPLSYNEVVDKVAELLGKRVVKVHLPVGASLALVSFMGLIPGLPKLNPEQVLRLNENKAFSYQEAFQDFGYEPLSFNEGIAEEIKEYLSLKR